MIPDTRATISARVMVVLLVATGRRPLPIHAGPSRPTSCHARDRHGPWPHRPTTASGKRGQRLAAAAFAARLAHAPGTTFSLGVSRSGPRLDGGLGDRLDGIGSAVGHCGRP